MGAKRQIWWWASATGGLVAGIALPPVGLPPLLWLALVPLWGITAAPVPPWAGALWGGLAVLISHRWLLALHPLDWIGVPLPLSLPLCLLLLGVCAVAGGLLVALWVLLARRLDAGRLSSAVLLSCGWGLVEVLLAKGPLFWLGLGASALPSDRALAGLAALGGTGLVAAVQLGIGWCLWRWWLGPARRRWATVFTVVVVVAHGIGAWTLAAIPKASQRTERVLVLQPAIPTRQKFQQAQQTLLERRLQAALGEGKTREVAVVLLPEGALGADPSLAMPAPVQLIAGGFRWQEQGTEIEQRSSLLRFEPGETSPGGWIDKHRVVPLGEWVPLAGLARWSGLSAVGGIEPGPASRLLLRPQGAIGAAICYEVSNGSGLALAVRDGARWLLLSANLDPYPPMLQHQFVALAQLRAIETGRAVVSVANTGPSVLVDARGKVEQQLPPGRPATGLFTVPQLDALTPYDRFGDTILAVVLVLAWLRRLAETAPCSDP
jgi:apolipoprotein N-acyltransferase